MRVLFVVLILGLLSSCTIPPTPEQTKEELLRRADKVLGDMWGEVSSCELLAQCMFGTHGRLMAQSVTWPMTNSPSSPVFDVKCLILPPGVVKITNWKSALKEIEPHDIAPMLEGCRLKVCSGSRCGVKK